MISESDLRLVLLGLRLAGIASTEQLVARSGLGVAAVEACLAGSAESGWVSRREGRLGGWILTADGREVGVRLLDEELRVSDAVAAVLAGYQRFVALNPHFLTVCTDWQLLPSEGEDVGRVPNDHRDEAYDRGVVGRLRSIDGEVGPVVAELAAALARFSRYRQRLVAALDRIEAGEFDWFTRPVIDSYHTVWFELHEDLLATLGRERSDERPDDGHDQRPEAVGPNTADDAGGAR